MTKQWVIRAGLSALSLVTFAPNLVSFAAQSAAAAPQTRAAVPAGQSATRLADGRWLLVGGQGIEGTAVVWDAQSGTATPTQGAAPTPRAWHSATVLADGRVLIAGGRHAGALVETPEVFDPATDVFVPIATGGAARRAGHTATLLTDGRVLVAGGSTDDGSAPPTEVWDLQTQTVTPIAADAVGRSGHRATLQPDGRVLFEGGVGADGAARTDADLFDPTTLELLTLPLPEADPRPPQLAASLPTNGATEVPLDVRIALRFSQPLSPDRVTAQTIALTGPDGAVDVTLVAAEQGRLLFVLPRTALLPETTYRVSIDGVVDRRGVPAAPASIRLTTIAVPDPTPPPDPEAWTPSSASAARGWRSERPPSPWETLAPLQAPPGVTAVSGRVLRLDGRPLAAVALGLGGRTTRTDRTGRFLLPADSAGTSGQTLRIDARTANTPARTYGFYEALIVVHAGRTTVLPFTIWSPLIDTAHQVTIASPTITETVVTTPTMPGFELHLPAGTVIRNEDGSVVRTLSLTPIPLDRTPFPMPEEATFTMFFTIQPGGAYLSTPGPIKGAWLVYPRNGQSRAGKRVQFFNYDPDSIGWYPYGMGTVTATSVVPDAKTRIYGFTGASFNDGQAPPPPGPQPGEKNRRGDPVDPSTGAFLMSKTDLVVPDVMPLAVTRTYNSQDTDPSSPRPFGIGTTHNYAIFLHSENLLTEADLILPDGGRVHYVKSPDSGPNWWETIFEHTASPTAFYKSRITFWGAAFGVGGWQLTCKDGTIYIFGHGAPLQAIRDRYGNETRFTWSTTTFMGSPTGNLVRVTSPNGRWIAFTYYAGTSRVYQATDLIGRTVTYTYDGSGRLATVTDAAQQVTTYTYDASNRLLTITDPRQIVYLTNQYTNGRVTQQTLADPAATFHYAYTTDPLGAITQTDVTDPRGHVERFAFNPDHYVASDTEALGMSEQRTTTYERQAGSNFVTAVVDPLLINGLNRRTESTYDDFGHVLTVKRLANMPEPLTITYTYEPTFFQLATVTDPLQHTWTIGYDSQGHLGSATDPMMHQTTFGTNTQGLITSMSDPLTHQWQFGYTGADRTLVTSPVGAVWRSFADAAGRVLSTTDPLGHIKRLMPDKLNRATTVTDPIGGQTSFTYDPNSRVLSLADASTHATGYTYDPSDRTATRTDPLQKSASYVYDKNDNLTQLTDRKGQITGHQYDALDRSTLVTYADTSTTQYVYDVGDRLTQVIDSVAGTVTRAYDGLDRLISETTPEGSVGYTYDADSRRATMTVAGQLTVTYGYDDAHRLTSLTQGTSLVSITYDDVDRRSTLTLPNGIVATYGYDNANQLTTLTYTLGANTIGTLTYMYDAAGNRTSVGGTWARTGLPEALSSATYDSANRITTWAGQVFSYDANGNLAGDGLTSYAWNARNQLIGLTGGTSASFQYDGVGRRRGKTAGGMITSFMYDGIQLVQELSGGTPTANLLAGLDVDEVFTRKDTNGTSALLVDALGSTLALADASGSVQTQYTFEPFGAATVSGAPSVNAVQFTGRENDGTGLQYFRARFYYPALERFVSEDPLDFAAGDTNLFSYALNAPTRYTDPLGLVVKWFPAGSFPACEKIAGRKDSSWWDRLLCSLELGQILPVPAAITGPGAKSAAELAKHLDQLNKTREVLKDLEQLLEAAKMPNTRTKLMQQIQKLIDAIAGHVKEIQQKWPGVKP